MPPRGSKTKTAAASAAATPAAAEKTLKTRTPLAKVLDISMSSARCAAHMKASLVPAEVEHELTEKRAAMKEAKAAEKTAEAEGLKAEIDEISEGVVRIGGDAPVAMAALTDYIVKSTLRFAMDQTKKEEHKMVEVAALHAGDPAALDVWPLICDLPAIASYDVAVETALKAERAVSNKAQKDAREAARKAKEAGGAGQEEKADAAVEDEDDEEHHGPSTTFHTYVDSATKVVKAEAGYDEMRVARRLREVLSDAVAEFVAIYSLVAKVNVLELLSVRTFNAHHLRAIVKMMYVAKFGGEDSPAMAAVLGHVDEKVDLYHKHLAAEKARKEAEMSPEKKAEREEKAAEALAAKKVHDIQHKTDKAKELAAEVKALKAEA